LHSGFLKASWVLGAAVVAPFALFNILFGIGTA
jgi:hypothetical protein